MKNTKKITTTIFFIFLIVSNCFLGCKKFIEVDAPVTKVTDANVFKIDKTAIAVLTNIYATMSNDDNAAFAGSKLTSLSLQLGLSSDEISLYNLSNLNLTYYYKNDLSSNKGVHFWNEIYPVIYSANAAIEGVTNSSTLSNAVKQQLLGEAKFIRAFCYFYLVNLYGDVPLVTTTNYVTNSSISRTSKAVVYNQITIDLIAAKSLLSEKYLNADLLTETQERVRPNKAVATALLSRVYLYTNQFSSAEKEASEIIGNSTIYDTTSLDKVFLKNSKETIWALQPVGSSAGSSANTGDGKFFNLPQTGPSSSFPVYLSRTLTSDFEKDDARKTQWISSVKTGIDTFYFANKYKIGVSNIAPTTEYPIVFRLAEQYLIRAEARVQQGNLSGGKDDLNIIRLRAGLKNSLSSAKNDIIDAINKERRFELFTEWGHRWLDLKRSGVIDERMKMVTPLKNGATWASYKALFPIPQGDILSNYNLQGNQNPGY